jgi:tetratricopeptide (TPR) repeat protein
MLSFLIDAQDWPPYPPAMKYTNLMIHCLCGLAICWFCFLLAQHLNMSQAHSGQLALLVTALWLLHPLNTSTTLYVIQRMTQLMALFASLSLVCYLSARRVIEYSPRAATALLCLALFPFALLSLLSKENGALLLLLIVSMELLFFWQQPLIGLHRWWYRVGVLLPLLIVVAYLAVSAPDSLVLYETRDFHLGERLLTQTRVLSAYLWKILVPTAFGNGLFYDNFAISRSLLDPITTLPSLLFIAALLSSAFIWRRKIPVYSFAVLWFFPMHLLESSYMPLEIYFEHRNYLAMVGPIFAVAWYFRQGLSSNIAEHLKQSLRILLAVIAFLAAWSTWALTNLWSEAAVLYSYWAEQRPDSIRAQLTYSEYLRVVDLPEAAMERIEIARSYHPNEVTVLLNQWNYACESGLTVTYSLADISANPDLEYYRDDINHHLRILLENLISRRCDYPDLQTLVKLFTRIGEFSLSTPRRSSYQVFFSDLYVFYGMLNQALISLTRAFELNPVPQIPIRQAILSASAGNYGESLVFLERAKLADQSRNPLLPSVMSEISRLENDFQRLDVAN